MGVLGVEARGWVSLRSYSCKCMEEFRHYEREARESKKGLSKSKEALMRYLLIPIIILIMIFAFNQNFLADDNVKTEVSMASGLEPKQVVDLEELLMSQAVRQEALIRLLVKKGMFNKRELSEMVRVVNQEMKPITVRLPTPVEGR
jgi:hypothetical protein